MLEKRSPFCKMQDDDIVYRKKTQKPCEKTNIRYTNFQNCPKRLKNFNGI